MTFWYGSRSADPYRYLLLMDLDPTQDPTPFFKDLIDAKKINFFFFIFFLITYPNSRRHIIFSLKSFASITSVRSTLLLEKGRIQIRTSDQWIRIREAQKYVDPAYPDPDHHHWFEKKIISQMNTT